MSALVLPNFVGCFGMCVSLNLLNVFTGVTEDEGRTGTIHETVIKYYDPMFDGRRGFALELPLLDDFRIVHGLCVSK